MELLRVRTASSEITLQHLAELDSPLSAEERISLLKIARSAAETAQKEYNRARHTQRPRMLSAGTLERNAAVPHAGMLGCKEYLQNLQVQTTELQAGVEVLDDSQEATDGIDRVRKCLDELFNAIEQGGAGAEMAEIRWWVKRKCMFWAAVDLLIARTM